MQISKQTGLGQDSVSKWRSRFIKRLPLLQEVAEKDPSSLEKAVCAFLNDSPRPGQPMHYTDKQIIKILETACRNPEELGRKGKSGILKSLESRAEFLHREDHRIRIVYTPEHCSWMNQIAIWCGIINRRLLKRKSYKSVEEQEAGILRFIEQYNLTAKPFKWTYKGVPLAA